MKFFLRLLLLYVLFLLAQVLAGGVAMGYDHVCKGAPLGSQPSTGALGVGMLLAYGSLLIILYAAHRFLSRRYAPALPPLPPRPRLWQCLLGVVGFVMMNESLGMLLLPLDLPDGGLETYFLAGLQEPCFLVVLTIIGPLTEECVFRAGLFEAFTRGRTWRAADSYALVALSALLFGVIHWNLAQSLPAACMGAVLMLMYLRGRSLWWCVAAHVANNSLAAAEMASPAVRNYAQTLPASTALALGAPLLVLSLVLLWISLRRPQTK